MIPLMSGYSVKLLLGGFSADGHEQRRLCLAIATHFVLQSSRSVPFVNCSGGIRVPISFRMQKHWKTYCHLLPRFPSRRRALGNSNVETEIEANTKERDLLKQGYGPL
jgi:hypothetical protein